MKKALKIVGWILLVLMVTAVGAWGWAYRTASTRYHQTWQARGHTFDIPFPLSSSELDALRSERLAAGAPKDDLLAGVDLAELARQHAIARGQHLVDARVGCGNCHGADLGGHVLIGGAPMESMIVGYWAAPNLTAGKGSVTTGFTSADWDRAVRHGIRHNGQSSSMPSEEFMKLSDHELSDIVAYVTSRPPVDREIAPVRIGPVFSFLVATDPKALVAFTIDHEKPHAAEPPEAAPSVEFGRHIAQVCSSCHGEHFSGGKVAGDPNMPIVANLTPHETGLKGWTEADFFRALREGRRKDGTAIAEQMPWKAYGQMSDTELRAVWAFLQTLPPMEKGNR